MLKNIKKIIENKVFKVAIVLLSTILTLFSLFVDMSQSNEYLFSFNGKLIQMFIVGLFIFYFYKSFYLKKRKRIISFKVLSFLFSFFMLFGNSYNKINSWDLIFGNNLFFIASILIFLGYFILFYSVITTLFEFLINKKIINKENRIFKYLFEDHPFISSFIIMAICWLPYIIAFYPAILSPDPSNQILQFFGIPTHYIDSVILIDPNVLITNHHPFFHTFILGGCVWLGRIILNDNFGLFIYSFIQTIILLSTLSYTLVYMKKLNTNNYIRLITLIIYSLVPVFPLYAMSAVKDVMFSCFVILYLIFLYDNIRYKTIIDRKKALYLIVLILLIMLVRNNGIYLVLMSFPFLFIINKDIWKKLLFILLIPLLIYKSFDGILLPYLKISPGSIREMLSIPFQQTARYVTEYGDTLTKKEENAIDKVLGIDDLKERYNPKKSDPVKNSFNKYATKEDLKEYFKVWFSGLLKHPNVYIESTFNNVYGYFYPNDQNWYIYYKYDNRLKDSKEFSYSYNNLKELRGMLSDYGRVYPNIPIIGMIVNIGFCTWIMMLIITFLIKLKRYKYLIFITPVISTILICIASPVNNYFRYAMPYVFAMPLLLSMFINILNEGEMNYEKK